MPGSDVQDNFTSNPITIIVREALKPYEIKGKAVSIRTFNPLDSITVKICVNPGQAMEVSITLRFVNE